jgi:HEAT repeat protein
VTSREDTGHRFESHRRAPAAACGWKGFWLAVLVTQLGLFATEALANGWEHTAIPYSILIDALAFPHSETRRRAAESLGVRAQPESVGPLTEALERSEPDPEVRSAIYVALGRIGDRASTESATRCLGEETQGQVRASCATALGGLGGERALLALIALLRDGEDGLVRARAVESLSEFADPRAVDALRVVLADADEEMRLRALLALGATGAPSATPILLDALVASRNPRERLASARALAVLARPEAGPILKAEIAKETSPKLRAALVLALAPSRNAGAFDVLVTLLYDADPAVQHHAIQGLEMLGRTDAAGALGAFALMQVRPLAASDGEVLVEDPAHTLSHLALLGAALRACTTLDAVPALEAMLSAAKARSIPKGSAAGLRVAEAVYEVRRLALYGLGYTGSGRAAALLSGADGLKDPDPRLRATAVRSLGVLSRPDSVVRVTAMLEDTSAEVRWTSAMVLGRLGDSSAGEALFRALGDENAEVRRQSALAVGYLGYAPATEALAGLASTDPDPRVRESASFAASLLDDD